MSLRLFLIAILLNTLLHGAALASTTLHFGPAPAWVVQAPGPGQQPNLREVNDGYYLKLFEQEANVARDELYQRTIKSIISDGGVQSASNVSISFNPAYEQVTVHQITVWRDGKPIDKLRKDAFKVVANEEDLAMFLYNGSYTAYLILDDIRNGDEIEYSYTISGSNPVFDRKYSKSLPLQGTDPIGLIHYLLLAPASRQLHFKYLNNATRPTVTNANGNTIYEWRLADVQGLQCGNNMPSWFNPFPRAQVSDYENWGQVADWAYKINIPADNLRGELAARVATLKEKHGQDKIGLMRALASIVQNEVRYMGVEIGPYSHKANNPQKVYEQRYGDCKDKSMLLVSMLRSAGLNADMALVNSSYKRVVGDFLPSPSVFNHAIVCVHLVGRNIWIDPTIAYQGGNGLDCYCPDYGKALVLTPGCDSLSFVPDMQGGEVTCDETYDITDLQKEVSLTVRTVYTGYTADNIRSNFATQSKKGMEKSFLDYYAKTYPHIKSTDTLTVEDDKDGNKITVTERYAITNFAEYDSTYHNYPVNFYASMIKNELPAVEHSRVHPIATNYPYGIHYTIHVNGPLNFTIKPDHDLVQRKAYSFSYAVSSSTNSLELDYRLTFLEDHIAPEDIDQYEKDRKKMIDDQLSFGFTYRTGEADGQPGGINYLSLTVFILLLFGCGYGSVRLYKRRTERSPFAPYEPRQIGGWLILPILGLAATVCTAGYNIFSSGVLQNSIWHVYDAQPVATPFKMMLWAELGYNTTIVCYASFCLYLVYKKRDILPTCMQVFYIGSMIFVTADNVIAHAILPDTAISSREIFRSVFATCIWVPYFSRAARVRETFIVAYPPEDPWTPLQSVHDTEHVPDDALTSEAGTGMDIDTDGPAIEDSGAAV